MNTQTSLGLSFNYDGPTDKPMMKALKYKMKYIDVEWESGDGHCNSETPFSVKRQM